MKTEVYVVTIINPLSNHITVTGRATHKEALTVLVNQTAPEFWAAEIQERAKKALEQDFLDVVEVLASSGLILSWKITKLPLQVSDPKVSQLRSQVRALQKELNTFIKTGKRATR